MLRRLHLRRHSLRRGQHLPGNTLVSAACADRSAFSESPCACTALEQLASLSPTLPTLSPWNALASAAYCQTGFGGTLSVDCAPVGGVQLPTIVSTWPIGAGLTGALPPSLGELGPSLRYLDLRDNAITSVPTEVPALTGLEILYLNNNAITSVPSELAALTGLTRLSLSRNAIMSVPTELGALTSLRELALSYNAITSVPTELAALTGLELLGLNGNNLTAVPSDIGALTGLVELDLYNNQLTGVPTEFRTWGPSGFCYLSGNPGFSCANVGAGTSCCTADNICGEGLSGGPCYTG